MKEGNGENTKQTYLEELKVNLINLGQRPEVLASETLRVTIANALEDLGEVGGKVNARIVISEVLYELNEEVAA